MKQWVAFLITPKPTYNLRFALNTIIVLWLYGRIIFEDGK
jgi:hypothetical protein